MKNQSEYIRRKVSKTDKDYVHLKLKLSDSEIQRAVEFLELESGQGTELVRATDELPLKRVSVILGISSTQLQQLIELDSLTLTEDGQSITGSSLIDLYNRTAEFENEDDSEL